MKIKGKTKKAEARIMNFIEDMQFMFGVQNMDRMIKMEDVDANDAAASIVVEEDYQKVYIKIYPSFWEYSLKNQRKYLLHEFCHVWTIPLAQLAKNLINGKAETTASIILQSERATSKIENVLDGLLSGRYRYIRRAYKRFLK